MKDRNYAYHRDLQLPVSAAETTIEVDKSSPKAQGSRPNSWPASI